MATVTRFWRMLTDRRVRCVRCGAAIGYVGRWGHRPWVCAACADSDGPEPA